VGVSILTEDSASVSTTAGGGHVFGAKFDPIVKCAVCNKLGGLLKATYACERCHVLVHEACCAKVPACTGERDRDQRNKRAGSAVNNNNSSSSSIRRFFGSSKSVDSFDDTNGDNSPAASGKVTAAVTLPQVSPKTVALQSKPAAILPPGMSGAKPPRVPSNSSEPAVSPVQRESPAVVAAVDPPVPVANQPLGYFSESGQFVYGYYTASGAWKAGYYDDEGVWVGGCYSADGEWMPGYYDDNGEWIDEDDDDDDDEQGSEADDIGTVDDTHATKHGEEPGYSTDDTAGDDWDDDDDDENDDANTIVKKGGDDDSGQMYELIDTPEDEIAGETATHSASITMEEIYADILEESEEVMEAPPVPPADTGAHSGLVILRDQARLWRDQPEVMAAKVVGSLDKLELRRQESMFEFVYSEEAYLKVCSFFLQDSQLDPFIYQQHTGRQNVDANVSSALACY
jgi:hypothetical protein